MSARAASSRLSAQLDALLGVDEFLTFLESLPQTPPGEVPDRRRLHRRLYRFTRVQARRSVPAIARALRKRKRR
jgi:hypothetical protein